MTAAPVLPAGYRLVACGEIDSTNAEAARQAAQGAPDGTVVWAEAQSGGRGRSGRPWKSPAGNLYCSFLLRPRAAPGVAAQLSFVAALAVADLARSALPPDAAVQLKWPNDVLVDGRKLSGILLEAAAAQDGTLERLVVGIGVNLAHHPEGTDTVATDLASEGGSELRPAEALTRLAAAFDNWRRTWDAEGFAPIRQAWLQRAWRLGEQIRVNPGDGPAIGRFAGIDVGGALVLELPSGIERRIAAGEVFPATA